VLVVESSNGAFVLGRPIEDEEDDWRPVPSGDLLAEVFRRLAAGS
jgi:hypothetical protein